MAAHSSRDSAVQAPTHPVPQLQGPFEESMLESVQDDPDADIYLDPIVRRNTLLEAPVYTRVVAGRWKQKPGERFHPLWKLIAQISFGIHLLAEGMAKSEDEVMQILQAHVDEIDGFLERTTEDFDLAQDDIQERLRCLKLPLSHPGTFDKMLEDRNFRLSIVEGNEKIEHIVDRTTQAMKDSLKDVQKGFDSTSCLESYLRKLDAMWIRQSIEHEAVFVAMLGNVEGWRKAFMSLHLQGGKLGGHLKKLTDIINEMQARAGEVSRRLLHQARGYGAGTDPYARQTHSMGRPAPGRNTPTSRFQTLPSKQLPGMPDRPPLRQAVSDETVRSQSSMSMRRQGGPSSSRQSGIPAARQVKLGPSPRVIQMGSTSSARVQSLVPSLIESPSSPRETPSSTTPPPNLSNAEEDEPPDRYFPPVELPAHVPEETLRQAPMSKQNRLSLGLGLVQSKRNSRLGAPAAALVDLLRKPSSHRSSIISRTPPTESPNVSRRLSVVGSNPIAEEPVSQQNQDQVGRSTPTSDNAASSFAKSNIRRPKKGVQHWFDAHDDDNDEDGKYSVQEDSTPQATTVTTTVVVKPQTLLDNTPGTPSWAVKSFAQADERRAELKKGAFQSHPPELPPGSPPLAQESKLPDPLSVVAPRRTPSHASSAGTLGEPGPAVTPSEAGSIKVRQGAGSEDQKWKRASAAAPEVVIAHNPPPMPTPPKQFFAEMEGSVPMSNSKAAPSSSRTIAMELEAPQQYFQLPPRPQPTTSRPSPAPQELTATSHESGEQAMHYQQYFKLPSRDSAVRISKMPPTPYQPNSKQHDVAVSAVPATVAKKEEITVPIGDKKLESHPELEGKTTETNATSTTVADAEETPQEAQEAQVGATLHKEERHSMKEDLQSRNVATPQIPLPPSPLEETVMETGEETEQAGVEETLFLLPAVAYKAPMSPKPSLQPLQTQLLSAAYTPPEAKGHTYTPPAQDSRPVSMRPSSSVVSVNGSTEASPRVEEPEAVESIFAANNQRQMQRGHKPTNLKHTRNSSSHGSQNGWKAFFTGQPSPVGSNLSIRSIQRESMMVEPRSPALLSPGSASTRFPTSPGANSAKDVVWFNRPYDEVKPPAQATSGQPSDKMKGVEGLGISVAGSDVKKQAVSAS